MKTLLLLLALASVPRISAQTAVYPGSAVTDAQLGIARNNVKTALVGSITSSSTAITLKSTAGMVANMMLSIGSTKPEIVWVCSIAGNVVNVGRASCPNVDGRGFDGAIAVAHTNNEPVVNQPVAWDHNAIAKEVEAIEANVNVGSLNVPSFMFTQTPGASLVAHGVNQTIPVSPCAWMAAGQDIYIQDGSAETVTVTSSTCSGAGGSGTITVTPNNNHTGGGYSISSATCGLGQAVTAANGGTVSIPPGTNCIFHGTARTSAATHIVGPGAGNMSYTMASSMAIPMIDVGAGTVLIEGVSFLGAAGFANMSTNIGIQISGSGLGTTSAASNNGSIIRDSVLQNFQVGINAINVSNIQIYGMTSVQNGKFVFGSIATDGDGGFGVVRDNILNCFDGFGPQNCTNNIEIDSPGGLQVYHNNILGGVKGVLVQLTMGNVSTSGTAVTRNSGAVFQTAWAGKATAIGPGLYTIASVTDGNHMTLTGSAGTQSTPWFYVPGGTSEIAIENNTVDMGSIGTSGVDFESQARFGVVTVVGNRIDHFVDPLTTFNGLTINASGLSGALIADNYLYSGTTTNTKCIEVAFGDRLRVAGNLCYQFGSGIHTFGSETNLEIRDNSYPLTTTALDIANSTGLSIDTIASVHYAKLVTLTPVAGSRMGCDDCDTPLTQGAAPTSAGDKAGATCIYNRGAWHAY
jgi:hypothetical protein